jgi:catechol 2,3-dioxygenase-like lactoylglutathione lyase family enzyme
MPPQIGVSEVVLRTSQYDRLREFYTLVLNELPTLDMVPEPPDSSVTEGGVLDLPSHIAFFNLYANYPYTQRIAIFECLVETPLNSHKVNTGIHHFQLRLADVEELFEAHRRLKEAGHTPAQSFNHGPSTSMYYKDPDGNVVELSSVNFATAEETRQFMATPAYQRNPEGTVIDPDDLTRRAQAGAKLSDLVWEK